MAIYMWREERRWQPNANTIAYYPLTSDINDYSGNNRNLTVNTGTVTYNSSTNMAETNWRMVYSRALLPRNSDFTVWCWCYPNSWCEMWDYDSWWPLWYLANFAGEYKWGFAMNGWKRLGSTTAVPWPCHIMITRSGSLFTVYINWQADGTMTESGAISNYSNAFTIDYWQNWIGAVIIESVARTATEVTDYYNQTKSDYGL